MGDRGDRGDRDRGDGLRRRGPGRRQAGAPDAAAAGRPEPAARGHDGQGFGSPNGGIVSGAAGIGQGPEQLEAEFRGADADDVAAAQRVLAGPAAVDIGAIGAAIVDEPVALGPKLDPGVFAAGGGVVEHDLAGFAAAHGHGGAAQGIGRSEAVAGQNHQTGRRGADGVDVGRPHGLVVFEGAAQADGLGDPELQDEGFDDDLVAIDHHLLFHPPAPVEGAVAAAKVFEAHRVAIDGDPRVPSADADVGQDEVVVFRPTHMGDARADGQPLLGLSSSTNDKFNLTCSHERRLYLLDRGW